jgi:hypothetical protein
MMAEPFIVTRSGSLLAGGAPEPPRDQHTKDGNRDARDGDHYIKNDVHARKVPG